MQIQGTVLESHQIQQIPRTDPVRCPGFTPEAFSGERLSAQRAGFFYCPHVRAFPTLSPPASNGTGADKQGRQEARARIREEGHKIPAMPARQPGPWWPDMGRTKPASQREAPSRSTKTRRCTDGRCWDSS